jgi:enamine deaminase RidA (YjgF/YER057c/UK114 family)
MSRIIIGSGSPWEDLVGYSRVVRVGNTIEVSGTVAVDEAGRPVGGPSAYAQTTYILSKIVTFIERAGGSAQHIVRTRMFVTDIALWEEIGRAHGEFFREIKPATSMVEVRRLIAPEFLVEIEATAIIT